MSYTCDNTGSADYQEAYYSVTNQWVRMRKDRIEHKQFQLVKVKQNAAKKLALPKVAYINQAGEKLNHNIIHPAYLPRFKYHSYRYQRYKKYRNNYSGHYTDKFKGTSFSWLRNSYPCSAGVTSGGSSLTLTFR